MFTVLRSITVLALLIIGLTACSTPTPAPTAIPTEPPTSTPVPPTATAVPTNTPIPSTDTPEPTATPRPTNTPAPTVTPLPTNTLKPTPTKAITPKPTSTKAAAAPAQVSSQPSNAPKSIQQAWLAAQTLNAQLNQLLEGRAELCSPMLQTFNSLVAAPTYDMNGQPANVQQAYALYRGAIDRLNTLGEKLRTCGQGGAGTVEKNQLVPMVSLAGDAANQLAQAWDFVRYEVEAASAGSPSGQLLSAVRKAMYDLDAFGSIRHSKFVTATPRWNPYPIDVTSYPCDEYGVVYNRLVNAPTFDVSQQSGNAQAAYDKYRAAVATAIDAARPIYEACGRQEGQISIEMLRKRVPAFAAAHDLLSQAIALLSQ